MSPNRAAALALVAGSLAGLVTMALHPTGREVVSTAATGGSNVLVTAVHLLAIVAQPLVLAGTIGLTGVLRARRELAFGALAFYALASMAVVIAAIASGLIAPAVARGLAHPEHADVATMRAMLHYTGIVNQSFAKVFVLLSGFAFLGWSSAMLLGRELSRGLGVYGCVLGAGFVIAMLGGWLRLDIHGFGLVVLGQGVWLGWAAVRLWRS